MNATSIDRTIVGRSAQSIAYRAEASRVWFEHWSSLRAGDVVPLRSAFDPLAVPKLLPHMLVCDLTEPGIVRIRLMGTAMVRNFAFDPTGGDYLDLVEPERRQAAYRGFVVPASHPCGMRVLGENRYSRGGPVSVETVGLPFRRDDGAGMQMVFVGSRLGPAEAFWRDRGRTRSFHVFERDFIDIGAGIPETA